MENKEKQTQETKKEKKEEKLTPRQWATYNLIKERTEQGLITNQADIVTNYPFSETERKDGYVWNTNKRAHDRCSAIWYDIEKINFNPRIEKIIIANDFKYKLAETKEEAEAQAHEYLDKAIRKLKRYWQIQHKIKLDGQGKLLSHNNEVIDEHSKAHRWFEAYVSSMSETEIDSLMGDKPKKKDKE